MAGLSQTEIAELPEAVASAAAAEQAKSGRMLFSSTGEEAERSLLVEGDAGRVHDVDIRGSFSRGSGLGSASGLDDERRALDILGDARRRVRFSPEVDREPLWPVYAISSVSEEAQMKSLSSRRRGPAFLDGTRLFLVWARCGACGGESTAQLDPSDFNSGTAADGCRGGLVALAEPGGGAASDEGPDSSGGTIVAGDEDLSVVGGAA